MAYYTCVTVKQLVNHLFTFCISYWKFENNWLLTGYLAKAHNTVVYTLGLGVAVYIGQCGAFIAHT